MKKLYIIFIAILFALFIPFGVEAKEKIDIYLFYSETCPHCHSEREFLKEYIKENEDIEVHEYEVTQNEENSKLLSLVQEIIDGETPYIPFTVIGNEYRVGFSNAAKLEIEKLVNAYRNENYIDVVGGIIDGSITKENYKEVVGDEKVTVDNTVDIPLLGKVDAKKVSLPLISVIIGLVDGFNPCAMWILIFLITMLINMKDKKKMWVLGTTFILTSSIVYFLFMMAWLTITMKVVQIRWIQLVIALVALICGFVNIRNYLKSRKQESGCVVVKDKKRKKIFERIKKFTSEKSYPLALIGVVILAVSVNTVELACSAGLPVLFTNLLALNNVSGSLSVTYIIIYVFFFMLDDLIVFAIAMITFKVTGVTTKYSKYTHLIGGLIMLLIGLLLIFKPAWIMFNF